MAVDAFGPDHREQQWAARAALTAAALAVLLPLAYGGVGGVLLLVAGLAGAALTAAALWWALTRRGFVRWAAALLAVGSCPASWCRRSSVAGSGTRQLTISADAAVHEAPC
jgi:hypothetical protein